MLSLAKFLEEVFGGKGVGFVLISISAAFIAASSFVEILESVKARLQKTQFRLVTH